MARLGDVLARAVTALVFPFFLMYLADEIRSGKPWRRSPRYRESPLNALIGLLTIGLPCLRYTLIGRFGREP
jgi:hypothetical protein